MYIMKLAVVISSIVHDRLDSNPRARARARGASGRARALDDDDVDVVVRPLQQQLPRERQLSSLLRRSQRPVQRLERVRHLIVPHERAELHLRRAIARSIAPSVARDAKSRFAARAVAPFVVATRLARPARVDVAESSHGVDEGVDFAVHVHARDARRARRPRRATRASPSPARASRHPRARAPQEGLDVESRTAKCATWVERSTRRRARRARRQSAARAAATARSWDRA